MNTIVRDTLKLMLDDVKNVNRKNITLVAEHFPAGTYEIRPFNITIKEDATPEDRDRAFSLLYHDCLEHKITQDSWGYYFLQQLYDQIITK